MLYATSPTKHTVGVLIKHWKTDGCRVMLYGIQTMKMLYGCSVGAISNVRIAVSIVNVSRR